MRERVSEPPSQWTSGYGGLDMSVQQSAKPPGASVSPGHSRLTPSCRPVFYGCECVCVCPSSAVQTSVSTMGKCTSRCVHTHGGQRSTSGVLPRNYPPCSLRTRGLQSRPSGLAVSSREPSCLSLSSAKIQSTCHRVWLFVGVLGTELRSSRFQG